MRPHPSAYLASGARPDDAPPPYEVVVFDCDSTLSDLEGIDALAEALGPGGAAEIAALTDAAMDGGKTLQEVYGLRLERIRPDHAALERLGTTYVEALLPSARQVVAALGFLGKEVHVVSGGLRPGVLRVGAELGLAPDRIHAVGVQLDEHGAYAGFDEASPLAREGGKVDVVAALRAGRPTALVGDGATDLEAAPELARFVAFGGVKQRAAVWQAARVHAPDRDLCQLMPLLCTGAELDAVDAEPRFAGLL